METKRHYFVTVPSHVLRRGRVLGIVDRLSTAMSRIFIIRGIYFAVNVLDKTLTRTAVRENVDCGCTPLVLYSGIDIILTM